METNRGPTREGTDPPYQSASSPYLRNLPIREDTPDGRELERAELSGCAPAGTPSASAGAAPEVPVRGFGESWLTSMRADDRGVLELMGASQVGVLDKKGVVAAAGSHCYLTPKVLRGGGLGIKG